MSQLVENTSGSKYSDQDRRQAAMEYAIHGTLSKTSEHTGIPERTLYDWKESEWWLDAVNDLREQNKDLIDAQLEQLAIKGFQAMAERIEHGDEYITKDGEKGRRKVSLRDLATASGIAYDKMRLHRNQPTSIKAESTDARLNQLAEKVRELQGGMVTIDQEGNKIDWFSPCIMGKYRL